MNAKEPMNDLRSEHAQRAIEGTSDLHLVWESRFGAIAIDVVNGVTYVNGERVDVPRDSPTPEV